MGWQRREREAEDRGTFWGRLMKTTLRLFFFCHLFIIIKGNKAQIGKVQQKKNERPKQTGQLYKTLWVDSPIEAKTVEKDNATNHHVSDRHTIRKHASRPEHLLPRRGYVGDPPSAETIQWRTTHAEKHRRNKTQPNHRFRKDITVFNRSIWFRWRGRSRIGGREKNLNRQSNWTGENGANGATESWKQKPAKRVLRKPPLPRDKSRTIIGGCNAGGKAGREHRNRKPKTKKQQTFSSS